MAVTDILVTVVILAVIVTLVILVIVVVAQRQARIQRLEDDARRIISDGLKKKDDPVNLPTNPPAANPPVTPPHNDDHTHGNHHGGHGNHGKTNPTYTYDSNGGCKKQCGCPCKKSCDCESKSMSSDSPSPCERKCGCPIEKPCECCKIPCAPQLNCTTFRNGNVEANCGELIGEGPIGQYYIEWFPVTCTDKNPITRYVVYVKQGLMVTPTDYDNIFFIAPTSNYFLTPVIGSGCWSFIVTADNACGQSPPSQIFSTERCQL